MSGDTSDEFQKELVDLFVQEAHEWLQNIHVALDELQQAPPPDRHASLITTITAGVTNLGGSAATINLPDVEQASFAALPFIEAIKDPHKSLSVQDFLSLCKQLGHIHTALTNATGVSFDAESEAEVVEAAPTVSPTEFVAVLQGLQQKRSVSDPAERNLINAMIEQMEGQVQAGVQQVGADVIQDYLNRMSESEEAFVSLMDNEVPALSAKLASLVDAESPPPDLVESSLQEVAHLRAESQQVNAGLAMTFFGGLQGLLTVIRQKHVPLAAPKVQAITARLGIIRDFVHHWLEQGRAERAAISGALPTNQ